MQVYKLKVENKGSGDFWYVFRRYTDFVRLCNRLRTTNPNIIQYLPRKRWLKNNFDPVFLEERVSGLQTLVNAILNVPELVSSKEIQDFFCLNEPPIYSETSEESKVSISCYFENWFIFELPYWFFHILIIKVFWETSVYGWSFCRKIFIISISIEEIRDYANTCESGLNLLQIEAYCRYLSKFKRLDENWV